MSEVEHRTAKHRRWLAWAGTREDLRQVGLLAVRLFEVRRKALAESTVAKPRGYDQMRLDAIVTHGNDSAVGPPEKVLPELDRRTVSTYKLEGKFYSNKDSLEITFLWSKKYSRDFGVTVKISSNDIGWANQAFAMLSEEVDKGQTAMAHTLQTELGKMIAGLTTAVSLFLAIFLIVTPYVDNSAGRAGLALVIGICTLLTAYIFVRSSLYQILFPAIELKGEEHQSAIVRRVVFLASLLVSVLIGVLVNRIS